MLPSKYNTKSTKALEKKSYLKDVGSSAVRLLDEDNVKNSFPPLYIGCNEVTRNDIINLGRKLKTCSSSLTFKTDGDKNKITEVNACNQTTICSVCASTKRNKIQSDILPYIKTIKKMIGCHFYMLTLTIKQQFDAGVAYEILRKSWTNFQKKGQKRGKRKGYSKGEASKIKAYVLSVENVHKNIDQGDKFHCHAHILLVSSQRLDFRVYDKEKRAELFKIYGTRIPSRELEKARLKTINYEGKEVPVSKLSLEWYEATRGQGINIDVSPLKDGYINKDGEKLDIEQQVYECLKYETKPYNFTNIHSLVHAWSSTRGKRKVTKGGWFTQRTSSLIDWHNQLEKYGLEDYYFELLNCENEKQMIDATKGFEMYSMSFSWKNKKYNLVPDSDNELKKKYENEQSLYIMRKVRMQIINKYRTQLYNLRSRFRKNWNTQEHMSKAIFIYMKNKLYDSLQCCSKLIHDYFIHSNESECIVYYIEEETIHKQLSLFDEIDDINKYISDLIMEKEKLLKSPVIVKPLNAA